MPMQLRFSYTGNRFEIYISATAESLSASKLLKSAARARAPNGTAVHLLHVSKFTMPS